MSSSREGTPDWFSSFQTPSRSPIMLTDSESSLDGVAKEGDMVDMNGQATCETSYLREGKHQDLLVTKKVVEPTLSKNTKSTRKRKQLTIKDDTPVKKKMEEHNEKGDTKDVAEENTYGKHVKTCQAGDSKLWTLSSDSESCPDDISIQEVLLRQKEASLCTTSKNPEMEEAEGVVLPDSDVKSMTPLDIKVGNPTGNELGLEDCPLVQTSKTRFQRSTKGKGAKLEFQEEKTVQKNMNPHASSSRLPLMLAEKVQLSKALVECEGESIDLSGDMGSVGRVVISDSPSGSHEMFLDLKGTIYKTTIVPSRTFCVVSFGPSEAKVEAIMNDFIQLKPPSNVYESETMVQGTLEGFSFDSEDEKDKMPKAGPAQICQEEGAEGQSSTKVDGKTGRKLGVRKINSKAAGVKLPKKVSKRAPAPKKSKVKKK